MEDRNDAMTENGFERPSPWLPIELRTRLYEHRLALAKLRYDLILRRAELRWHLGRTTCPIAIFGPGTTPVPPVFAQVDAGTNRLPRRSTRTAP